MARVAVLFVLGVIASTVGCTGEELSIRAQTAARRHVLLPLREEQSDEASDGTLVDGQTGKALDLARCARLCSPALMPGERVAACFQDHGLPKATSDRLPPTLERYPTSTLSPLRTVVDCALQ